MSAPVLQTERLLLRPHELEDFAHVIALWADPVVVEFISGKPSTEEESWTRLLRYIGHWQALDYGFWVVEDRATGQFLGEIGFADFHRGIESLPKGIPEAGWVLTPHAHGRGIATEAVRRIHHWADVDKNWPETRAIFNPLHLGSQRVAQKLGYQELERSQYKGFDTLVMRRRQSAATLEG